MKCIFCDVIARTTPSFPVYEDDETLAFLDIFPATEGHTLVVPKRHTQDLLSAEARSVEAMMRTTQLVARLLDDRLKTDGINLFQANRPAAWQTVFHLHMHVIPRYSGDPLRLPWTQTAAASEHLEVVQSRVVGAGIG